MKKNLFMVGTLVAALTVVTGCSNEDLATDNGNDRNERMGGITEITASTPNENPNTRLVYEHLSVGGLKVNWKAYDAAAPEQFYMKSFLDDLAFSYLSSQKSEATTQSPNCVFDIKYPSDGEWKGAKFYLDEVAHAIYPVKEYGGEFLAYSKNTSVVTIDLPLAAQTGKLADMKDFDYMTATGAANANTEEEGGSAFNLTFKHRVAVLCLKGLTFEGLTGDASISSFSFSGTGVKPSAKLTMAKEVMTDVIGFSGIDDAAIATAASTFAITDGQQTENAYICFFPNGGMTGQEMTVSATVGNDTYSGTFTAPKFVEGNMYTTAAVTMKKKAAEITWATGNLVANADGSGCEIGQPTDVGLFFQFGSLVGWSTTNPLAVAVKPAAFNGKEGWAENGKIWQGTTGTVPFTVKDSDSDDEKAGIGDPCRYYLKDTWRLPTKDEYMALFKDGGYPSGTWKWENASATNTASGLTFPASGFRTNNGGSLDSVGTTGCYWSASPRNASNGYYLYLYSSTVSPSSAITRAYGMPVRCVQNASN